MTVCVLGSVNLDTVLRVDRLPLPGETLAATSSARHLGGKGANQAVSASRMGAKTLFVGAVGQDSAGARLRQSLIAEGVDVTHLNELVGQATGRAYITLDSSGQNSIVVAGGANGAFCPDDLPVSAARTANVLLSQLETPIDAIARLFSAPRPLGSIRILNAAPALPEGRALFDLVDILIVNETELMTYTGLGSPKDAVAQLEDAARSLVSRPDQIVIVTLGSVGAAIVSSTGVRMVAGRSVNPIDTTGAGDCFCGVLAAELDRGADLETAVEVANAAAALSVTRPGAAGSSPLAQEVEAFLAGA